MQHHFDASISMHVTYFASLPWQLSDLYFYVIILLGTVSYMLMILGTIRMTSLKTWMMSMA
jgi:hypothetical protein